MNYTINFSGLTEKQSSHNKLVDEKKNYRECFLWIEEILLQMFISHKIKLKLPIKNEKDKSSLNLLRSTKYKKLYMDCFVPFFLFSFQFFSE